MPNTQPANTIREWLSNTQVKLASTIGPGLLWLLLLAVAPLVLMFFISFTSISDSYDIIWDFTLTNYKQILASESGNITQTAFYQSVLISYFIAFVTTIITLVIAYPVAYLMVRRSGKYFKLAVLLILVPFFTVYIVRAYSWYLMFGSSGVINQVLLSIGLINQPLNIFDYGMFGIIVALTHSYFPYMFFALYASLTGIDFSSVEAAKDLGAGRIAAFKDIVLPLTAPGILSGCVFVFVPSLGSYITPQFLSQGKILMIAQMISIKINTLYAIDYGSAMAMFIIVSVIIAFVVVVRYAGLEALY